MIAEWLPPGPGMLLAFGLLLVIRVPVAFALALSAGVAMWRIGFGLEMAGDLFVAGVEKYSLLAIPFFILAGALMGSLGIARRLIDFFRSLIGNAPGGMGLVGTVMCLFWGAVSGSGPASVAAIGPLVIRSMEEDGYGKAFAAGLVSAGAALSIVIPPSIGLIIYGVIAEVSIAKMFIAAIIPGMVMGMMLLATLPFDRDRARRQRALRALQAIDGSKRDEVSWPAAVLGSGRKAFWALLTPVVVLGGIYGGIVTPTEAAIVATVYTLFVGLFIYRDVRWSDVRKTLVEAASASAFVMLIVAYASLFGWVINVEDLIGRYSDLLIGHGGGPIAALITIMVILLVAGMFVDAVTILLVSLPIFLPVARSFGWDPVWFGVVVITNLAIGLITPPVGINLFVSANITKLSIEKVAVGAMPFLVSSLAGLVILIVAPGLSQWLVR